MSGQIIYRSGNRYIQEEKFAIVKDYLESNLSRNAIVKKYQIGQGTLIAWLRIFGYECFMEHFPGLLNRVKLKYVAEFLGISIYTLSRIRSSR